MLNESDIQASSISRLRALLACITLVAVSVEYLTQALHDHRKVTLAIEAGVRSALEIHPDERHRQVLLAGNSLVFEDVSRPALQQAMGSNYRTYLAGVPGSTYSDWRFGLRSLFARGGRPDVVVFGISPSQFLRPPDVTPTPVSVLWRMRDIFDYYQEQRLSLNKVTELFLDHYSVYFSLRDTIRIYIRKFIPGYESMLESWASAPSRVKAEAELDPETAFAARLSMLQAACSPARLVIMIAPTNQVADQTLEPSLKAAAEKLGISLIEPVANHEWPSTNFRADGYHLNPIAANEFSALAGASLKRALEESPSTNISRRLLASSK